MTIHTVTRGETIGSLAKKYGLPAELIIRENLLTSPDELVVGESLLIFQPRVVYTVRKGDTLDSLTKLFGLSKNELWQMNPLLRGRDELIVGQELIIEYAEPRLGDLVTVAISTPTRIRMFCDKFSPTSRVFPSSRQMR